jgi:hypothetical protein
MDADFRELIKKGPRQAAPIGMSLALGHNHRTRAPVRPSQPWGEGCASHPSQKNAKDGAPGDLVAR